MLRKIIIFIIISVSLLALFGLGKQITEAIQSGKRLDEAANELSSLQDTNSKLQKKLTEVQSLSFIEEQLRNKLNLAKPNETIVIIPQKEIEKVLGGSSKKIEELKLPNWQAWLRLFIH